MKSKFLSLILEHKTLFLFKIFSGCFGLLALIFYAKFIPSTEFRAFMVLLSLIGFLNLPADASEISSIRASAEKSDYSKYVNLYILYKRNIYVIILMLSSALIFSTLGIDLGIPRSNIIFLLVCINYIALNILGFFKSLFVILHKELIIFKINFYINLALLLSAISCMYFSSLYIYLVIYVSLLLFIIIFLALKNTNSLLKIYKAGTTRIASSKVNASEFNKQFYPNLFISFNSLIKNNLITLLLGLQTEISANFFSNFVIAKKFFDTLHKSMSGIFDAKYIKIIEAFKKNQSKSEVIISDQHRYRFFSSLSLALSLFVVSLFQDSNNYILNLKLLIVLFLINYQGFFSTISAFVISYKRPLYSVHISYFVTLISLFFSYLAYQYGNNMYSIAFYLMSNTFTFFIPFYISMKFYKFEMLYKFAQYLFLVSILVAVAYIQIT